MSERVLKTLHVGVANRGQWPLKKRSVATGFLPEALCDLNVEAMETARVAWELPKSACFTDLDFAIAESKVECAIVCTPTKFHVPMAEKLIRAGIPVLIEKGMAPDWKSAQQLVATAKHHRGILCVAQNYRYKPAERTLARAIHDPNYPNYVGPVHLIVYNNQRVRPEPRTLNYPFASIWDMSCHHLDSMMSWLGPIKTVTAQCWGAPWSKYEYGNNTTAFFEFENGARGHYIHTHDAARGSNEIQLHGERGAMYLREDRIEFNLKPTQQLKPGDPQLVQAEPADDEVDLLRDFHAYITRGIEPGISGRNNLETMAACEMMVRSITENRPVSRTELEQ